MAPAAKRGPSGAGSNKDKNLRRYWFDGFAAAGQALRVPLQETWLRALLQLSRYRALLTEFAILGGLWGLLGTPNNQIVLIWAALRYPRLE